VLHGEPNLCINAPTAARQIGLVIVKCDNRYNVRLSNLGPSVRAPVIRETGAEGFRRAQRGVGSYQSVVELVARRPNPWVYRVLPGRYGRLCYVSPFANLRRATVSFGNPPSVLRANSLERLRCQRYRRREEPSHSENSPHVSHITDPFSFLRAVIRDFHFGPLPLAVYLQTLSSVKWLLSRLLSRILVSVPLNILKTEGIINEG
jgi:hypothetical protein